MMSQRDCHLEDNLELGVNQVERRLASVEVEQYKICTGSDRLQSQVVTYKIMQQWRWWIFTLRTIEHGIQDLRCAQSQGDVSDDQGVSSCQLKQHRHQLLLFFCCLHLAQAKLRMIVPRTGQSSGAQTLAEGPGAAIRPTGTTQFDKNCREGWTS